MTWDGRYQLQRTLGEGGMGRVLLARDLVDKADPVALKILLPEFRHSIGSFLDEFVTQRSFEHPNIPRVHDFGFAKHPRGGEVPYFTMEYCRGVPMILAIRRLKQLGQAWPWVVQLLRALDYVHRMGWLHRDLKPGNILVDLQDTSERCCRLIDLGVASELGAPTDGVFIGTPEYCAPEMLSGDPFDQTSDLYAFGLVLYEILEKRRPWTGSDEQALRDARLKTAPPEIENPDCPEPLKALIYELLSPRPASRPQTAFEVLERFCQATGQEANIDTEASFKLHLQGQPFPGRETFLSWGDRCLSWLKPGEQNESGHPRMLVARAPGSFDASRLLQELGDRGSVNGSRVVRLRWDGSDGPLGALKPALQVFRRLREVEEGPGSQDHLKGCSGAATMLTRLHGPTLLIIEDLQRGDRSSIEVLRAVLTAARNENLRVVASINPDEEPTASESFEGLLREKSVEIVSLPPLEVEHIRLWSERAIGSNILDDTQLAQLHETSNGAPAGVIAALHDLFRRNLIQRVEQRYALIAGAETGVASPSAEEVDHLDALLSVLEIALPQPVVEAYLGEDAEFLPSLVTDGVLVSQDSAMLVVNDERWRAEIYTSLQEHEQQQLHRRLARAIHASERFTGQRQLVANQLMRSDRPALAAPHLVVAASEATGTDAIEKAQAYLDQAEELLQTYVSESEEGDVWRWRAMLYKARVRQAMQLGDLEAFDRFSQILVEVGTEMAHMPTLAFALESQVTVSFERGLWSDMVRHAESRLALEPGEPSRDALALRQWALAMRHFYQGQIREAFDALEEGAPSVHERPRPAIWVRLAEAKVHFLITLGWTKQGHVALSELREATGQAGEASHTLMADLYAALLAGQAGLPEVWLEGIRTVSLDMPADHVRHLSARIELERARVHLAFGWARSARDHAQQAGALAERDHDPIMKARAAVLEAASLRMDNRLSEASSTLQSTLVSMKSIADWPLLLEARIVFLDIQIERSTKKVLTERLAREALNLGESALKKQAYGYAAHALGLQAIGLLKVGKVAEALESADRALVQSQQGSGRKQRAHYYLYLVSLMRRRAGRKAAGDALALRAVESIRKVAETIEGADHRRDWLASPDNAALLGHS